MLLVTRPPVLLPLLTLLLPLAWRPTGGEVVVELPAAAAGGLVGLAAANAAPLVAPGSPGGARE